MVEDNAETPERRSGKSLRLALLMLALSVVGAVGMGYAMRPSRHTHVLTPPRAAANVAPRPRPRPAAGGHDELIYRAEADGHFYIDAEVNGATIRFLVDTGATSVALTPRDARAIGLSPDSLRYDIPGSTANGVTHGAGVNLRDIRLGQFTVENVPAVVLQNLHTSLLGMSFLSRLNSYRISNGVLTMEW